MSVPSERRGSIDPILEMDRGPTPASSTGRNPWSKSPWHLFVPHSKSRHLFLLYALLLVLTLVAASLTVALLLVLARDRGTSEAAVVSSGNQSASQQTAGTECQLVGCVRQAAHFLSSIDRTSDPCTNFYQYACGSFGDSSVASSLQPGQDISSLLSDLNSARLRQLLNKPPTGNLPRSSRGHLAAVDKVRMFYMSCGRSENGGRHFVRNIVQIVGEMGGVEVFGSWQPKMWKFNVALLNVMKYHLVDAFFRMERTSRVSLRISKIELPNYLSLGNVSKSDLKERERYADSIKFLLELYIAQSKADSWLAPENSFTSAECGDKCISEFVQDILEINSKLHDLQGQAQFTLVGPDFLPPMANSKPSYMTVKQLDESSSHIEWRNLIFELYGASAENQLEIDVPSMNFIEGLDHIFATLKPSQLQNYMMFAVMKKYNEILRVERSWQPVLSNQNPEISSSTHEHCLNLVQAYMPRAVQGVFIHDQIGSKALISAQDLVNRLLKSIDLTFNWMSAKSRNRARQRLANISTKFGHFQKVEEAEALDAFYRGLELDEYNFFYNTINVHKFLALKQQTEWRDIVPSWQLTKPQNVRIFYEKSYSTLLIPYGALQVPWYNEDVPDHINVATLGSIIFAVLARIFLPGADDDFSARLWDDETLSKVRPYQQCVNKMFRGPQPESPLFLITPPHQGESFARSLSTHFGLSLAKLLYHQITASQAVTDSLMHVPATEQWTPEQMFFLAFAQTDCEATHFEQTSVSSQATLINGIVASDPDFQRAFSCPASPNTRQNTQPCQLFTVSQH